MIDVSKGKISASMRSESGDSLSDDENYDDVSLEKDLRLLGRVNVDEGLDLEDFQRVYTIIHKH